MAPRPTRPADQPTTNTELQTLCDQFRDYYNQQRPHRSLNRSTPAVAYQARPKATPSGTAAIAPAARVRNDIVDNNGKLTLRHNGKLHHIGIGRHYARTPVLMLIHGLDIHIIHAHTGHTIRQLTLNPDVDYQARGVPRSPEPRQ